MAFTVRVLKFVDGHLNKLSAILKVEEKLLSTLLYKNHHRFRNDKGFKDLKIVLKYLNRFIKYDVQKAIKNFSDLFPLYVDVLERPPDKLYFPTASMLDYALVTLQGAFNLMRKLIVSCHNAADLCFKRLHLGHFWNVALNHLGTVSRIWSVSTSLMGQFTPRIIKN